MQNIAIGDEVYSHASQIYANVEATFPAAVCVRVGMLAMRNDLNRRLEFILSPQLWRADEIENLSVCRCCGSRENLIEEYTTGIPSRICPRCRAAIHSPQTHREAHA